MIRASVEFDQRALAAALESDAVVQHYRSFFALLDWMHIPERALERPWPGGIPHPEAAYVKALLVKLGEQKAYVTDLRSFLVKHPLLVLELGFRPVLDPTQPYGFDVEQTVPCDRWLRHKQQTLDNAVLRALLRETVHGLQQEIPGLGETVAVDVKHIYAWVQENNPKAYVTDRYDPDRQPQGDPDCRLGVKRSSNQEQPNGTTTVRKEYVWGYGTGIVAATDPRYGDVVLADYTQPFNETDPTYYRPLYQRTVETLGFRPKNIAADAAFDAWYVYQDAAEGGGMAAVPLNTRGRPVAQVGPNGIHLCPKELEMIPLYEFVHTDGYRAQVLRCPLLVPAATGQSCDHEQFAKGVGCVKQINITAGGKMRIVLDRQAEEYKRIYRQRTAAERINSQAKALGIERPQVRNSASVHNLNTLTYVVINARALARVRAVNVQARLDQPSLC
jgi:Transposase DDE domain